MYNFFNRNSVEEGILLFMMVKCFKWRYWF